MNRQQLFRLRRIVLFLATAACILPAEELIAQDSGASVVRVEEDWELYVGDPDPNSAGPQVSVTMSPVNHLNGAHAVLEFNHQSVPNFAAGGLQLQTWNGETADATKKFPSGSLLSTPDECIRWTQSMQIKGTNLTFSIDSGSSTTWGDIGGGGYLVHSRATSLTNLNGYSPEVSVGNSGVGYGGNRVKLLVLRSVRFELSNGQVFEDNTARIAHQSE